MCCPEEKPQDSQVRHLKKKKRINKINNFLGDIKHPPLCILMIIMTIINDDLMLFFHRVMSAKETHWFCAGPLKIMDSKSCSYGKIQQCQPGFQGLSSLALQMCYFKPNFVVNLSIRPAWRRLRNSASSLPQSSLAVKLLTSLMFLNF